MSGTPIVYRSETALTPDQGRDARAGAWKFVFDCYYAKKNAASVPNTDGDEAKGPEHEVVG